MTMSEFQKKKAEARANEHIERLGDDVWQRDDFMSGYAACAGDAQVLVEALEKNKSEWEAVTENAKVLVAYQMTVSALKKWRGE